MSLHQMRCGRNAADVPAGKARKPYQATGKTYSVKGFPLCESTTSTSEPTENVCFKCEAKTILFLGSSKAYLLWRHGGTGL